jgi:signal transduction histidine kinase
MSTDVATVAINDEEDVVYARQRARLIAELLGFDRTDQTRISTAVSEIARNAYQYGGGGEVAFLLEGAAQPQFLAVTVRDQGPGIKALEAVLEGSFTSRTGMGLGIVGTRRLMDQFSIESAAGAGTTVFFGKTIPAAAPGVTADTLSRLAEVLAKTKAESPLEEVRLQNQELLHALGELRQCDEELTRVNRELTETNTGVVALYADLENTAEQLRRSEEMLRCRNENLQEFTHTVSHDLKAPLRGIAGYANELDRRHRAGLSERAEFCITQVLTATRNMDHLIEDLLHYSRMDAQTTSLTEVDLRGLVEAILKDRGLVIDEQHIEVTVDIPFTTLQAWERGLVQALANLIDNAIKYSCEASPSRLGIRAVESGTAWRLSVSDNGIGFDMKYVDRIFGLFNRLVRADEFEGTGVGLAIAKKALEKQGGRIWAESAPGRGATFFVELPKPDK